MRYILIVLLAACTNDGVYGPGTPADTGSDTSTTATPGGGGGGGGGAGDDDDDTTGSNFYTDTGTTGGGGGSTTGGGGGTTGGGGGTTGGGGGTTGGGGGTTGGGGGTTGGGGGTTGGGGGTGGTGTVGGGTGGGSPLTAGFESNLTDFFGCVGTMYAVSADDTIALSFDGNDLAADAFITGNDTTYTVDLGAEGWRLEVIVGTDVSQILCTTGTATVDYVYTPTSGTAVLDVWPHKTQAEQTEGALSLTNVVLEAPGAPSVTLVQLDIPRMVFTAL